MSELQISEIIAKLDVENDRPSLAAFRPRHLEEVVIAAVQRVHPLSELDVADSSMIDCALVEDLLDAIMTLPAVKARCAAVHWEFVGKFAESGALAVA